MKYALISEEQIKQIKWVLDNILTPQSLEPLNPYAVMQTLSVLRSLKPQEPVAYGLETDSGDVIDCITPAIYHDNNGEYTIPLFALEQT